MLPFIMVMNLILKPVGRNGQGYLELIHLSSQGHASRNTYHEKLQKVPIIFVNFITPFSDDFEFYQSWFHQGTLGNSYFVSKHLFDR